jgi:alpha-amylase
MSNLCFYFQAHQPLRLKPYSFFDIGSNVSWFNEDKNREVLNRVSDKCYLPANSMLQKLIQKYPQQAKFNFSLSGIFLEQINSHRIDVLESFQALIKTNQVELFGETYYHSLASMYSTKEFDRQIKKHTSTLQQLFQYTPTVFRNTELLYHNNISNAVHENQFKAIWIEGSKNNLHKNNPDEVYFNHNHELYVIPRNYKLSDDIAFRFNHKNKPLTVKQFIQSLDKHDPNACINIGIDYETLGEHFDAGSGILTFFEELVQNIIESKKHHLVFAHELMHQVPTKAPLSITKYTSWADTEKDDSAWRENDMQREALDKIYSFEPFILKINQANITEAWARLLTSDHFYYMSTKRNQDGEVHQYFSPFNSPYDAYVSYMNVVADFELQLLNIS